MRVFELSKDNGISVKLNARVRVPVRKASRGLGALYPWATAYAPTEGWPALRVRVRTCVVLDIYLYISKMA